MRCLRLDRWFFILIFLSLLTPGGIPAGASERAILSDSPAVGNVPAGPRIVEADEHHVVLEWVAPPYQASFVEVEGQAFQRLSIPSCPPAGRPGEPEVPACTTVLGIPPDVSLSLQVLEVESLPLPGEWSLPPVPEPALQEEVGRPESMRIVGERYLPGPVYQSALPFPPQPAALGEPAFLRHQRLVAVSFFPLEYHPLDRRLVYHPRLRLEIAFGEGHEARGLVAEPPEFERLLSRTLLNYARARSWRRVSPTPLDLPPPPPDPGFRIPVEREGLYRLTYASLEAAGLPVDSLDPRTLRLFRYGQEVAIRVLGEEDGHFDPQDQVLFYGRPLSGNRYTNAEVYWLTYGGAPGRRMARRDGRPGGGTVPASYTTIEHLEEDHNYYSIMPWRPDHDHWFWNYTYPEGGIRAQDYLFPAHPLAQEAYTATLRLHLHGGNRDDGVNPDHHIRILLNGTLLGELWWDGRVELTPTLTFSSNLLLTTGNVVRVEAPGDTGAVADWVVYDWLELEEHRRFVAEEDRLSWEEGAGRWEYHLSGFSEPEVFLLDITDADAPVEIVSATVVPVSPTFSLHFGDITNRTTRYLAVSVGQVLTPTSIEAAAPAGLRRPDNGADYLVITHGDFYTQAQALVSFRAGRGLRARAVDVRDVYDLFAYGRRIPEAIHDFLAYAYENWSPPAPSYVVLLGDGHFDPKDHRGYGLREYILPYLALVDPWFGETAADNRYVCLSGDDLLPDMHLGRLPANTPAEAQVMVGKIIAYESAPPPGDWRQQALFVADNPDQAGDFPGLSDALIEGFYPPPYQSQRVYLGNTCSYENPSVACRNEILSAVNAGRLLVNYIGHGGIWLWANERLLDNFALPQLANAPYLPVVLGMTCYEGMYHWTFLNPNYYSLAETFLRAEGKGWVASWSPTGLGVATGHHYLNEGFFQALFQDDERRLGPATLAGKVRLWQAGSWRDLLDTYLLLGDPALEMPLLETDLALEKTVSPPSPLHPGDPLTFTLRLSASGPATAHHIVLTDTLSPLLISPTVVVQGLTLTERPGPPYTWEVSDMSAGQEGAITIAARLSPRAASGFLTNEARVTTSAKETDRQNNVDSVTLLILAGPPALITATATPPTLPADGTSLSLIRATVRDIAGNPVADGTPVLFTTDAGSFLGGGTTYTDVTTQGVADAILRSGIEVTTATVRIASGNAWWQVEVPFLPLPPYTITVWAEPPVIPVTGTAQITAQVEDVLGHPVADGTPLTLTTTLGTITPAGGSTRGGIVTATLEGDGRPGWAVVTARSGDAVGTTWVRFMAEAALTLTMEITPTQLPADGCSRAQVRVWLLDAQGQPVSGTHWVTFSTTLGSIPSRTLAVSGTAAVSLTAGTRAGTALVIASAEGSVAWGTVRFLPGEPAALTLTAWPAVLPVGGARSLLTAALYDAWGNPVSDGTLISLSTSLGVVSPTVGGTWRGVLQAVLISGEQAGTAAVLARSGPVSAAAEVLFLPLAPATLTLAASPPAIVADGVSSATLSAWVGDTFGNPVEDGTAVHFSTTLGRVFPAEVGTVGGWATAVLTGTEVGTATVQAQAGAVQGWTEVALLPGPPAVILVTAEPTSLVADGVSTATVRASLADAWGHPVADGTPVAFTTSLGTVTPTLAWTEAGRAQAVLRSGREAGWARVQASSASAWGEVRVRFFLYRIYLPLVGRSGIGL